MGKFLRFLRTNDESFIPTILLFDFHQYFVMTTVLLKNGDYSYDKEKGFLGKGSFGSVFRGVIVKTGKVIAIKVMSLAMITQIGQHVKTIIRNEVKVLKDLSKSMVSEPCPFIIRIYDCFLTEHNICLVLEFCDEGDLSLILKQRGRLPEKQALDIIYQIVRALDFLAKKGVTHRDLKPDNIFMKKLMTKDGKPFISFKLGDFGFAVKTDKNRQIAGTYPYMSPEIFRMEQYGSEVDVWALGVIAHELLFGVNPFIGRSKEEIQNNVVFKPYEIKGNKLISPEMTDFLSLCLKKTKKERIKSYELIKHPVFKVIHQKYKYVLPSPQQVFQMKQEKALAQQKIMKQKAEKSQRSTDLFKLSQHIENEVHKAMFLQELGRSLLMINRKNCTSIYLIKECLCRLSQIYQKVFSRTSFTECSDFTWKEFCNSDWYQNFENFVKYLCESCRDLYQSEEAVYLTVIEEFDKAEQEELIKRLGEKSGPVSKKQVQFGLRQWATKLSSEEDNYSRVLSQQCIIAFNIDKIKYDFGKHLQKRDCLDAGELFEFVRTLDM